MSEDWEDHEMEDGSFEATARVVDARPDEHDRQVEVALRPRRPADFGPDPSASSCRWSSKPLAAVGPHRTTSCSRVPPGWARRRWR